MIKSFFFNLGQSVSEFIEEIFETKIWLPDAYFPHEMTRSQGKQASETDLLQSIFLQRTSPSQNIFLFFGD